MSIDNGNFRDSGATSSVGSEQIPLQMKVVSCSQNVRALCGANAVLLCALRDGALCLYDMTTGSLLSKSSKNPVDIGIPAAAAASRFINVMSWHSFSGGAQLWAGCADGRVLVFNKDLQTVQHSHREHTGAVRCIAAAAEVSTVWTGSEDWTIWQRKASDGTTIRQLRGHNSWVRCLATFRLGAAPGIVAAALESPGMPPLPAPAPVTAPAPDQLNSAQITSFSAVAVTVTDGAGASASSAPVPASTGSSSLVSADSEPTAAAAVKVGMPAEASAAVSSVSVELWSGSDDGIRVWNMIGEPVAWLNEHGTSAMGPIRSKSLELMTEDGSVGWSSDMHAAGGVDQAGMMTGPAAPSLVASQSELTVTGTAMMHPSTGQLLAASSSDSVLHPTETGGQVEHDQPSEDRPNSSSTGAVHIQYATSDLDIVGDGEADAATSAAPPAHQQSSPVAEPTDGLPEAVGTAEISNVSVAITQSDAFTAAAADATLSTNEPPRSSIVDSDSISAIPRARSSSSAAASSPARSPDRAQIGLHAASPGLRSPLQLAPLKSPRGTCL